MEKIDLSNFNEKIKLIENTENYYITNKGNILVQKGNSFYKKKIYQNPNNYYMYCGIKYIGNKNLTTVRVHRLVAIYFIQNPDNYKIVGHKDNDKTNNIADNLYWTTTSENTKKAYNDNLAKNAKGYDDSQSISVYVFNMNKELIDDCGSMTIASKKYNVSKSTVARQCRHEIHQKPRCGYYFRFQEEFDEKGFIL